MLSLIVMERMKAGTTGSEKAAGGQLREWKAVRGRCRHRANQDVNMKAPRRPQAQSGLNVRCTTACKIAEALLSFELLPFYHLLIWLNDSGPRVADLRRSAIPFHVLHQWRPDFHFMLLLKLTASTCVSVVCKDWNIQFER